MATHGKTNNSLSPAELLLMDGTSLHGDYVALARRGEMFLGIKFVGLASGAALGMPDRTFLRVRVRSQRSKELATLLDQPNENQNVVHLKDQQLTSDGAWPELSFEKVDGKRASLSLEVFIQGSMADHTAAVITRVEQGDLFGKLVDYVMQKAGPKHSIVDAQTAAAWLLGQAKPALSHLKKASASAALIEAASQKLAKQTMSEAVGPHLQMLGALIQAQKLV